MNNRHCSAATRTGVRRAARDPQRGSALLAVVPIAILMMSLMVAFVGTSVDTSRANTSNLASFKARAAAQSAASLAIADLWNDYTSIAGANMQLWELRAHLDAKGMADQSSIAAPTKTNYKGELALAANAEGRSVIDGVEIERVEVYRIDEWDSTRLVVEVDAVSRRGNDGGHRERRSSVQEVFEVAPPAWEGLNYAMLANNINCLLCHTQIDNAERFYNQDPTKYGTFEPVQIGSIDAIHFRDDPDSKVAGVLLIGEDAILGDGDNVSDWSKFNLTTAARSGGKLAEDKFGDLTYDKLSMYDKDNPDLDATMYLDFFNQGDATGYQMPKTFPSPYPDTGGIDPSTGQPMTELAGNRIVDDSEFAAATAGSNGAIRGGDITVVDHGDAIDSNSKLAKMQNGQDSEVSGVIDGNVYLQGTKNDPLLLDGTVAFDGDVIISGYVKGDGSIKARGNVYVIADLVYDDGGGNNSRTYGVAADGSKNSLAIAAGGNIVIGDPARPAWGTGDQIDGTKATSFNFTMDELAIFNRMEWMKTQPTLPGKSEYVKTGSRTVYYDEKVKEAYWKTITTYKWVKTGKKIKTPKYKWIWVSNGLPGEYEEKTKKKVQDGWYYRDEKKRVKTGTKQVKRYRWVKTGRRLSKEVDIKSWVTPQIDNPYYSAEHTPRYYSYDEGTPIPVFNKQGYFDPSNGHWKSDERAGAWDDSKLSYANVNDPTDPLLYDGAGNPIAVVSTIAPSADWISDDLFTKTIANGMAQQANGSKVLEVNGTLYSANSILGMVPERNSSKTNGELLVNGGIVAADVGILAPKGTQINFDGRGTQQLQITSDNGLTISRRYSMPMPAH